MMLYAVFSEESSGFLAPNTRMIVLSLRFVMTAEFLILFHRYLSQGIPKGTRSPTL